MNHLQWYDYMRMITAVFAVWAAWRMTKNIHLRRRLGQKYSDRLRDFLWLLYAYWFIQFTGAIEAVQKNSDWKWTTLLSFLVSCVAVRATRKSSEELIT